MPVVTHIRLAQPKERAEEIAALVARTFAASEGADEGLVVGNLAEALLRTTPEDDVQVFGAEAGGALVGAGLFSRLVYPQDPRVVFLLSPMAVAPDWQGQGVGQGLLRHGLGALRDAGVDVAMTYGDPAFYGRVGFRPMTPEDAAPPMPLSMPHGWIGQALGGEPWAPLKGPSTCALALRDPALW